MSFIDNVIHDLSPKSWLSEFKDNSLKHITALGFFYYGIALLISWFITNPAVVIPKIPFDRPSIIEIPNHVFNTAVFAPIYEETLLFGLPHYLSGNPIVTLICAATWSVLHLFVPLFGSAYSLSVDNFLPTIPVLFFGLRTWKSGKGKCSILAHGIFNLVSTIRGCEGYVTPCPEFFDIKFDSTLYTTTLFSISILVITYYFFKRNQKSKLRSDLSK